MQKEMPQLEIIYVYTRAEAIEDKVLIDVSELARKVGFECPVAITSAVYADCVASLEGETEQVTRCFECFTFGSPWP